MSGEGGLPVAAASFGVIENCFVGSSRRPNSTRRALEFAARSVPALHFQLKHEHPVVAIERPDLTVQYIPLSWTDRASPNPHQLGQPDGARLSGLALLEVVALLAQARDENNCHGGVNQ